MKFAEFHRRVNALSLARHGVEVNARKLRDWISGYRLRSGHAGSHTWTHTELNRVLLIAELRSRGIASEDETLIHVWLHDIPVPLKKLRLALLNELRRIRWTLLNPINSTYDARKDAQPSSRNSRAIVGKAGTGSPEILPSGFTWPDPAIVGSYSVTRFGSDAKQSASVFSALIDIEQLNKSLQSMGQTAVDPIFFFSGVVGDPEEIGDSAETSILNADQASFDTGRKMFRQMRSATGVASRIIAILPPVLRLMFDNLEKPAQRVSKAFDEPNWGSLMLAACVHYQFRRTNESPAGGSL